MERGRETATAALCAGGVFVASFLLLRDAPVFLPHQGVQSVLAADSLMAGRGFEVTAGVPFAKFGPLYPVLLAALGMLGVEATPALYAVNCAALATSLFATFVLGRMLAIRAAAAVAVYALLWAPHYYLLRAARPDLLAIALSLLGLIGMIAYARRPAWPALLGTALACAAAATTRYQAVLALLPVFGLAILLPRGRPWRRRAADLGLYGLVAAGPVALWMLRNFRLTGFVTGLSRSASREQWAEHYGLGGNVLGFLKTVYVDAFAYGAVGTRGVVYGDVALPWPTLAAAGAGVAGIALCMLGWQSRDELRRRFTEDISLRTPSGIATAICAAYFLLYSAALIVVWTLSNNDPLETRYVAPLYPLLLLVPAVLAQGRRPRARLAALVVVAAIAGLPNAAKSRALLADSPPGPTYFPVAVVGPRGSNWMPSLTWAEVAHARPAVDSGAVDELAE